MSEGTKLTETIRVSIPGIRKENYSTTEEVQEWIVAEREAWQQFWNTVHASPMFNSIPNVHNDALQQLNKIEQHLGNFRKSLERDEVEGAQNEFQRLKAAFENYSKRDLISSEPVFASIIETSKTDPDVATVQFMDLVGGNIPPNSTGDLKRLVRAIVIAEQNAIDPEKALATQKQELKVLAEKWEADREDHHLAFRSLLNRQRRNRKHLENAFFKIARDYSDTVADHEKRMSDMETAFSTDMKLKAAEKFWGNKRRLNRRREKAAQTQLYVGLGIALIFLIIIYVAIYKNTDPALSAGQIFLYLAPTILAMWPLRVFANNLRSNKDMADDAEEREAMVMTFKALEYEDKVADEERLIILNALFRPHERSGEEGIPHPAWEAIIKRMGGGKSD